MDTNQDPTIFEAYKPLRNGIRKLELADSLAVIRAYMSNLQFNQDIRLTVRFIQITMPKALLGWQNFTLRQYVAR